MAKRKLEVQEMAIADLKPWPHNPRKNDEAVDAVVKSIESFGYTNPVLVRKANKEVIAGHTRIKAAQKLGWETIPVILLDMDEVDAHVYALFDNKSVENVPWDGLKLAEIFNELDQMNVNLDLTGFSRAELENYVIGPTDIEGGEMPRLDELENEKQVKCPECGHEFTA